MPAPTSEELKRNLKLKVCDVATAGAYGLINQLRSFSDLVTRYRESLRRQAKDEGAVAFKSGIVIVSGADVEPVTPSEGEQAWEEYRSFSPDQNGPASSLVPFQLVPPNPMPGRGSKHVGATQIGMTSWNGITLVGIRRTAVFHIRANRNVGPRRVGSGRRWLVPGPQGQMSDVPDRPIDSLRSRSLNAKTTPEEE